MSSNKESGDSAPKAQRMGTMEVTAKEGVRYLRDEKHDGLIEVQGLSHIDADGRPKTQRTTTMEATLADAAALGATPTDGRTRADKHKAHAGDDDGDGGTKAKVHKHTTMQATKEEGKAVLAGEKLGGTRAETKQLHDDDKTAQPKRTQTMNDTLKESSALLGDDELGSTRSETSASKEADKEAVPPAKRTQTMKDTVEAAAKLVDADKLGGTRSETKQSAHVAAASEHNDDDGDDVPGAKRTNTMEDTLREAEHVVGSGEKIGSTRAETQQINAASTKHKGKK